MRNCNKKNILILSISAGTLLTVIAVMIIDVNNKNFALYAFEGVLITIFLFSILVSIFSCILLFLKEQVFTSWWGFAKWYLIGSAILIAITPVGPSGGIVSIDAELVSWWLASLFFIISLIIIIRTALYERKNSSQQ